mgnify:FL=1
MTTDALFSPIQVGSIALEHRIALAPLTRLRAHPTHVHSGSSIRPHLSQTYLNSLNRPRCYLLLPTGLLPRHAPHHRGHLRLPRRRWPPHEPRHLHPSSNHAVGQDRGRCSQQALENRAADLRDGARGGRCRSGRARRVRRRCAEPDCARRGFGGGRRCERRSDAAGDDGWGDCGEREGPCDGREELCRGSEGRRRRAAPWKWL